MKNYLLVFLVCIGISLAASLTLQAQAPSLPVAADAPSGTRDPLFGSNGRIRALQGTFSDMIMQPNGELVILETTPDTLLVHRYTAKGAIDTSFGLSGLITITREISTTTQALTQQPDGRLLLHIDYSGQRADSNPPIHPNHILRFTASGALDPSWGGTGVITTTQLIQGTPEHISMVQPLADGNVLVASRIRDNEPYTVTMALTRYTSGGSLDTIFHTTGTTTFTVTPFTPGPLGIPPIGPEIVDVYPGDDGILEVLTAVYQNRFDTSGGYNLHTDCCYEHRFTTSGLLTTPARKVINIDALRGLQRQPNQSILVLAHIIGRYASHPQVARYTPTKQLDPAFNQGQPLKFGIRQADFEFTSGEKVVAGANGDVIVAGTYSIVESGIFVSQIDAKGSFHRTTFATEQRDESVIKLLVQADGGILVLTNTSLQRYIEANVLWLPHFQR